MVSLRLGLSGAGHSPFLATLFLWFLGSLALGLMGPYGTWAALPLAWRVLFWGAVLIMAIAVGIAIANAAVRTGRALFPPRPFILLAAQGTMGALILGPIIWALCRRLPQADPALVPDLGKVMLAVLALWLCVAVLRGLPGGRLQAPFLLDRLPSPTGATRISPIAEQKCDACPAFLTRAGLDLPGAVMRISADNHYLMIQTTQGRGRVMMRFRDALPDLEAEQGLRIHRSHWVAAGAVSHLVTEGRRHFVVLVDGARLPVSQSYLAPLQAMCRYDQRGIGRRMGGVPSKIASAPLAINSASAGRSQNSPPV